MIAAGRPIPDRLVEDDRGAQRVGQAGDRVRDPDAAQALVGEAPALGIDNDARRGEFIDFLRERLDAETPGDGMIDIVPGPYHR